MIIRVAVVALLIYVGYAALLFLTQRRMVFPTHLIPAPDPTPSLPADIQPLWVPMPFGQVEAWLLLPESRPDPGPVAIFAHGNGELIDYWASELRTLTRHGVAVLMVEYPGYGRSDGSPSQRRIAETFQAAYDLVTAREDVDRDRVILIGRSLGGGAVAELSTTRPAAALVLLSTFTTARSFARRFLVPGVMVRDPFDNLRPVGMFAGPVLVVHGRYDEVIPYRHGVALTEAASDGELLSLDCGHNDCPTGAELWEAVAHFLRQQDLI